MFFRGLAGRHVAQAQLMQSCLAVVKASMLVVQRSQEPISTAVLSASSDQSDLHQVLSGLLNCYTCILTDGIVKTTVIFICKLNFFVFTFLYIVFIFVDFCFIFEFLNFFPPPHPEEFVQTVQSTAGMAVVLFIRSIMGNGDDVPVIVSERFLHAMSKSVLNTRV